ncbi:hypothetical protein [Natronohydrobacter thiooxidans]|uniref:hypothetical protein n=1 Tax=Natronohydrobacter thiooxidans TaxID=87172 RepID=UPI0011147457|nr:hypothetical protein [Natronohydrobacter thiooxidans]
MKALPIIIAMSIGFTSGPANALERTETHLNCLGLYALLRMAAPNFADFATERMGYARQSYFRDLPVPSPVPMPLTGDEIEAETRARMRTRGRQLTDAETDEDIMRETDAFLAEIRTCDARYGLTPTPIPWRD